jgi:hypothetical protein
MARLTQLYEIAQKFGLKLVTIADLITYKLDKETLIERGEEVNCRRNSVISGSSRFFRNPMELNTLPLSKGPGCRMNQSW